VRGWRRPNGDRLERREDSSDATPLAVVAGTLIVAVMRTLADAVVTCDAAVTCTAVVAFDAVITIDTCDG
jgi:hypothetical protein